MKHHRHYGQYIDKTVRDLKKKYRNAWAANSMTLVWDQLDREFEIHISVKIKKKPTDK